MDRETWNGHYKRLLKAYNKPYDGEQAGIYFDALESLPGGMVGLAADELIKVQRFWPHVSDIREKASSLLASATTYEAPECPRCGGNTWVDAAPRVKWDREYTTVDRCPHCWTLGPARVA